LSLLIWYCSLLQHFYALLFPEKMEPATLLSTWSQGML
jgi:hypothetical protein